MKTSKLLLLTAMLLFLISGCGKEKTTSDTQPTSKDKITTESGTMKGDRESDELTLKKESPSGKNEEKMSMLTTSEQKIDVSKRLVVKIGTLNLEIDNFEEAEKKVSETVKKYNGYVSNSTSSTNASGKKSGSIVLKVPVDKYDELINDVSAIGKVASKNISSNDVTEEYIDLESRAKTQKELEQRLLKLLAEKTARLVDIVEVEEKLAAVRQKIESVEGKMKLLMSQATYSTLTVAVYEPSILQTPSGGGFFYEIGEAVKKGLNGLTSILSGLIAIVIALIPVIMYLS